MDTCAFCITLVCRGWQHASEATLKGGHAEHIHANCDCEYAIRFGGYSTVAGYDPEKYLQQYRAAGSDVKAMRRMDYMPRTVSASTPRNGQGMRRGKPRQMKKTML